MRTQDSEAAFEAVHDVWDVVRRRMAHFAYGTRVGGPGPLPHGACELSTTWREAYIEVELGRETPPLMDLRMTHKVLCRADGSCGGGTATCAVVACACACDKASSSPPSVDGCDWWHAAHIEITTVARHGRDQREAERSAATTPQHAQRFFHHVAIARHGGVALRVRTALRDAPYSMAGACDSPQCSRETDTVYTLAKCSVVPQSGWMLVQQPGDVWLLRRWISGEEDGPASARAANTIAHRALGYAV